MQRKWPPPTIRNIVSSVHTCEDEHISQPCAICPRNSSLKQKAVPANIHEVSYFWKTTNIMKAPSFCTRHPKPCWYFQILFCSASSFPVYHLISSNMQGQDPIDSCKFNKTQTKVCTSSHSCLSPGHLNPHTVLLSQKLIKLWSLQIAQHLWV